WLGGYVLRISSHRSAAARRQRGPSVDSDPRRVARPPRRRYKRMEGPPCRAAARGSRMESQLRLGRVFGIEIGLHYSWFLIALLITTSWTETWGSSTSSSGVGPVPDPDLRQRPRVAGSATRSSRHQVLEARPCVRAAERRRAVSRAG